MKNNRSIKYISFFIFMAILMSIFSLSVFATDEIQDEEDEELTLDFWQGLALIIVCLLSPIISIVWGSTELIKQFCLWIIEIWPSIVNFFAGL